MTWRATTAVPAAVCGAVVVGAVVLVLWWSGIPNAQDAEIAFAVCRFIRERHGGFPDVDEQRELHGKAIFAGPGVAGNASIDVYGITAPEEIAGIERLAQEALRTTPGASSVRLRFYDKQNWRVLPGGTRVREDERLLKSVTYDRMD